MMNYVTLLKDKAMNELNQMNKPLAKRLLTHASNVIDVINIEDYFRTKIDENYLFLDEQKAIEEINNLSIAQLNILIQEKITENSVQSH